MRKSYYILVVDNLSSALVTLASKFSNTFDLKIQSSVSIVIVYCQLFESMV